MQKPCNSQPTGPKQRGAGPIRSSPRLSAEQMQTLHEHVRQAFELRYHQAGRELIDTVEGMLGDLSALNETQQAELARLEPLLYPRLLLVAGIKLNHQRSYGAAKQLLARGLELTPSRAPFYGELLVMFGQSAVFSSDAKRGLEPLHTAYHYFSAARHFSTDERLVWQGKTAFYLGAAYQVLGDPLQALQWMLTALEHDQQVGFETFDRYFNQNMSERLPLTGNIAIIYDGLGEYDRAVEYYNLVLDEAQRGEHHEAEMVALYNLGVCSERQGHHERALGYLKRAVALSTELSHVGTTADAWQCIAGIYLDIGRYSDAETALGYAHTTLAPIRDDHARPYALTLLKLGRLRLSQQRPREAIGYFHDTLAVLEKHGILPEIAVETHQKLADTYERIGALDKALEHLRGAYKQDIDYHQTTYNDKMQTLLVKFEVEKARQDKEIYRLKNVELEREVSERRHAEAALARKVSELEALHVQLSKQAETLKRLSERDGLTGLYNRRMLDTRLASIFADSVRDNTPLCVMICDIDNFKSVNDIFSHATGDEVLRIVARLIEDTQPRHSLSARYGGEEFVIVFPGLTIDESHAACETLRERIEAYDWATVHPDLTITLSLGLTARNTHENQDKLLDEADAALYRAKRSGKNRVCIADLPS